MFSDDFSDSASGWGEASDYTSRAGYYQGEYRILVYMYNYSRFSFCPYSLTDFAAEVTTRQGSSVQADCGLVFGASPASGDWTFYEFAVTDRYYALFARECDWGVCNWRTIVGWTYSTDVKAYPQANRLRVVRQGTSIELYINGKLLRKVTDSAFVGQLGIGMFGGSGDYPNADARFDDFALYTWYPAGAITERAPGDLSAARSGGPRPHDDMPLQSGT